MIVVAVAFAAAALAGCANRRDAGPCPGTGILYDAEHVTAYKAGGVEEVAYKAVMSDIALSCAYHGKKKPISAALDVTFQVQAEPEQDVTLPYFVAVMRLDGKLLAREEFSVAVKTDASGNGQQREKVGNIRIPLAPGTTGASYKVIAGLRLTPEQAAANRRGRSPN